ncbi:LacI family transcriptional regulator [Solirubrobacter taibaiensis]|nr:LacI family transcriptional regulator [Solirubrobacter taibaiensis]
MGAPRGRGPTIRDVARQAGVSAATVSRVLNDSPLVVEPTRARVQAAVDELGYRMNATARTLSLGRSTAVGVLVPFFTTHSAVERLRGVVARLARHGQRGYDLLLFDVEAPEQRADAMRDLADRNRVAGLLIVSLPIYDHEIDALQRDDLPAVLLDVTHPRLPRVVVDNVHGGELAAEHLLAKGHSRIAFLGDHPTNEYGFTSSEDRRRGFGAALERAGIRLEPALERFGHPDRDEGETLARSLLAQPSPPTAIFAASDVQAIGVLKACEALGVRVPEDVAVMGFDDVDLAEIVGLTTIRQPLRESGGLAADLLVAAIEHGVHDPVEEVQALTVVERRTT